MSNPDSFIDEVNDEVRRDRLYAMLRRYGWIGIVAVVLIVAGAAWSEYQKAQARAQAEALGDSMLSALNTESAMSRAGLLATVDARTPEARAVAQMMAAAEYVAAGDPAEAVALLEAVAVDGEIPEIYRLIAGFKVITMEGNGLSADERRSRLQALAQPGGPLRLLAEEQLALSEISGGNPEGAIDMFQSILVDAEATADLQQRALQVIVALGGTPELGGVEVQGN